MKKKMKNGTGNKKKSPVWPEETLKVRSFDHSEIFFAIFSFVNIKCFNLSYHFCPFFPLLHSLCSWHALILQDPTLQNSKTVSCFFDVALIHISFSNFWCTTSEKFEFYFSGKYSWNIEKWSQVCGKFRVRAPLAVIT